MLHLIQKRSQSNPLHFFNYTSWKTITIWKDGRIRVIRRECPHMFSIFSKNIRLWYHCGRKKAFHFTGIGMTAVAARIRPHYFIEIVFLFSNDSMFISLLPSHIEIYTTESVQNLKKVSKIIEYFVGIAIFLITLDIILNYFFF